MADHLLLKPQQSAFVPRLHQLMDECGGGDKAHGQALLAGGQPEAEGDVGLACPAWAERDDILTPINPFATRQFQHLHLVQGGDRLEVEAVQTFDGGELCGFDPALDHPAFPVDHLQLNEACKELNVVQPLGGSLLGEFAVFPQNCWQPQRFEAVVQKDLGSVAHAARPRIRDM